MSEENVALVMRGFERFQATGEFMPDDLDPEFVWDMSTFTGWPEKQIYPGLEGAQEFMRTWLEAWDDWKLEAESIHDNEDKVVGVMRQHGRSKTTGLEIDMRFAQLFTVRDGKVLRMQMYDDPDAALRAIGLEP